MDPEATFAIVMDDSNTREDRLEAIADLEAWIDNGGYIPTRLSNRMADLHPYSRQMSARMWLDGFAVALCPTDPPMRGESHFD